MEIKGTIIAVLPLVEGVSKTGNEWKKQDYVLETTDTQYPKKICFNLWGDRITEFSIQEGEQVTVQIDIESREFNGRWYTDVRAWRVDRGLGGNAPADLPADADAFAPGNQPASPIQGVAPMSPGDPITSSGGDDLPF